MMNNAWSPQAHMSHISRKYSQTLLDLMEALHYYVGAFAHCITL